MQLSDIKLLLEGLLEQDIDQLYTDFHLNTGQESTDEFLKYLLQQELLTEHIYQEILDTEKIEVTRLDALSTLTSVPLVPTKGSPDNRLDGLTAHQGLKNYALLHMVGEGAMGIVHLARDQYLRRKVAFKQLHQKAARDKIIQNRFLAEVQITAQLDHPNVVPVYTLETNEDGSPGYAMKIVQGQTFKELIEMTKDFYNQGKTPDEPHSLTTRLRHFLKVCDALSFAHNKGVIHRDLKPANIMIGRYNEVYVMDWGIARLIPLATANEEPVEIDMLDFGQVEKGQIVGTPRYMSPEQASGQNDKLDARSDQFALGLILFEWVSLKQPIIGSSMKEVLVKIIKGEREPFTHYSPKVKIPPELDAIVTKATQRKRTDRYNSVTEMADDIRRYMRGEAVLARSDTPVQKLLRWSSRHRQTLLLTMMGIFLLGATTTIAILYYKQISLATAQKREEKLSRFLSIVSNQSQLINSQILSFESLLTGLASAGKVALERGTPVRGRLFMDLDFQSSKRQPPDLVNSSYYGKPISLNWPVFKLAPGVQAREVDLTLRKLLPLRHLYKRMFLESHADNALQMDRAVAERLIQEQGVPLIWAYIGLEKGIHFAYPGQGGYPANYDPRQRPWYRLSAYKKGIHWGKPYQDAMGAGLIIPCTTALYNRSNHFLGVAGVEITFPYIVNNLMPLPAQDAVRFSYLLDNQGRVMVRSNGVSPQVDTQDHTEFPLFPNEAVREKIKAGHSGYVESRTGRNHLLLAFSRIDSLNWYYLVVVDAKQLF